MEFGKAGCAPKKNCHVLYTGYIVLNPGCPAHKGYFDIADLVVVSERNHLKFIIPPAHDSNFRYLATVGRDYGLKLTLPQPAKPQHTSKFGVIIHGLLPDTSHSDKLVELRKLVHDLVCIKRVGTLFITDVELEKADIYAHWSSFWTEFIEIVAEANAEASARSQSK